MITVVGTIKICDWRYKYFTHSLKSVAPIAHLLSWRLNIAGGRREEARNTVMGRWEDAAITIDDNDTCTYDLIGDQIASLPDDALIYPWVEDVWFVCPYVNMFLYVLDKFVKSNAEVMPVSHLLTVWEEQGFRLPIMGNRFHSEYLINLPSQEQIWKNSLNTYWVISISSIFKVNLFRDMIECRKERLSLSCRPHGLELPPEVARGFLAHRSFIRLVPHFHIFREISADDGYPPRCISWGEAAELIDIRDTRGISGGFPEEMEKGVQEI